MNVHRIQTGSPTETAGVKTGDIIQQVGFWRDGEPFTWYPTPTLEVYRTVVEEEPRASDLAKLSLFQPTLQHHMSLRVVPVGRWHRTPRVPRDPTPRIPQGGRTASAIIAMHEEWQSEPGFAVRFQRDYNPDQPVNRFKPDNLGNPAHRVDRDSPTNSVNRLDPDNPKNPTNRLRPNNPTIPTNRLDPDNPENPINRLRPINPENPVNRFHPENPRNPVNRNDSTVPFRPLE